MLKLIRNFFLISATLLSFNAFSAELEGEFTLDLVNDVIANMNKELEGKPKGFVLDLYLNSGGGSVFAGNKLIHEIMRKQSEGYKVRGIVTGACMSMCFITLQYLDVRTAYPLAWIMDHDASGTERRDHIEAVSGIHKKKVRSKLKIDHKIYDRMVAAELLMDSPTALKFGLLDKILMPGQEKVKEPTKK